MTQKTSHDTPTTQMTTMGTMCRDSAPTFTDAIAPTMRKSRLVPAIRSIVWWSTSRLVVSNLCRTICIRRPGRWSTHHACTRVKNNHPPLPWCTPCSLSLSHLSSLTHPSLCLSASFSLSLSHTHTHSRCLSLPLSLSRTQRVAQRALRVFWHLKGKRGV